MSCEIRRDHHAERGQHRKVAPEALAADPIEDQIGAVPSGDLDDTVAHDRAIRTTAGWRSEATLS
jgi:hypothetical protein